MLQQRRRCIRAFYHRVTRPGFRPRISVTPAVVLSHKYTARFPHKFRAYFVYADTFQRISVRAYLLLLGQVGYDLFNRKIRAQFLQRSFRLSLVRPYGYRLHVLCRSVCLCLIRYSVSDSLEQAQLTVVKYICALLTALSESRTVLVQYDLVLFFYDRGEPVDRCLQRRYLLYKRVYNRLWYHRFAHAAHRPFIHMFTRFCPPRAHIYFDG